MNRATTIRLSPAMWEQAKIAAIRQQVSLAELVDRALRNYLTTSTYSTSEDFQVPKGLPEPIGTIVDAYYEDETGKRIELGDAIIARPDVQSAQMETSRRMREELDAVSDIPVKSRGKGKCELPKMLPRK